jgi:hypothetical protein
MKERTLTTLLVIVLTISVAGQPKRGSDSHTKQPDQQPSVSIGANYYNQPSEHSSNPNPNPPGRYAAIKRPEWWLVFAALATLAIVCRQTIETKRAVQVGRDSADAARRSADALVNIERAWIFEEIRFPNELPLLRHGEAIVTMVVFELRNRGRTPARIRDIRLRFHTVTSADPLPDMPRYTETALRELGVYGRMMATDDEPMRVRKLLEGRPAFTFEEMDDIRTGKTKLYAYGRVDYESLGMRRFTQFCYQWYVPTGLAISDDSRGFRKDGPLDYNRNT